MNAWPIRARIALAVSAVLVVAGAVPVLYFTGLVAWQVVTLVQTGSWVALPAIYPALVFALAGAAMIAAGVLRALRQRAAIHAQKLQKQDRVRRVQDYLREVSGDRLDGRREPFIARL